MHTEEKLLLKRIETGWATVDDAHKVRVIIHQRNVFLESLRKLGLAPCLKEENGTNG